MQYIKCHECYYKGHMCQMVVASGLATMNTLEETMNRGLTHYRREREDSNLKVKMDFICKGFKEAKKIDD